MSTEVFALINFVFTSVLAFMMYRYYVLNGFENQKRNEEIHQEMRNQMESVNGRLDNFENRINRDLMDMYREMNSITEALPKKKTTGRNSQIPF